MTPEAKQVLDELKTILRRASVAEIGGFRPSADSKASWFGKGVCLAGEGLPFYAGKEMFPLLQINVGELPFAPDQLSETKLLVVFFDREELPFDRPHADGWLIREYLSLDGLVPLPAAEPTKIVKPFPIKWNLVEDDAPGWETAGAFIDLKAIDEDDEAEESFFEDFNSYACTKVGGFPDEIQHAARLKDFVFQIGTEEKANWMWVHGGTAYFYKDSQGNWSWDCQFF